MQNTEIEGAYPPGTAVPKSWPKDACVRSMGTTNEQMLDILSFLAGKTEELPPLIATREGGDCVLTATHGRLVVRGSVIERLRTKRLITEDNRLTFAGETYYENAKRRRPAETITHTAQAA